MRTNLILHFHCSKCGERLQVIYENRQTVKSKNSDHTTVDREPTGADCRYVSPIQIEPCRGCYAPIKKFHSAIKDMENILKGEEYARSFRNNKT